MPDSIIDYAVRRYVASQSKTTIERDAFSSDSTNWLFNPLENSAVGRLGSAIVGDSLPSPTGLLESKIGARCCELCVWRSSQLTYPTYGAIYGDESDKEGTVYVRSTTGPSNYQLGEEFGSTHYPTSVGSVPRFKMVPLWCEASQLHTRAISSTQRKFMTPGTRRHAETQNWSLFPSAMGTPMEWNKGYNEATGSGSNVLRVRPWGHMPPMFPPTKGTQTASSGTDANFSDGDTFYLTVFFEDETGALSPAFQCRPINATLTAGLGLYTIGTVGSTSKYRSVQFDEIPLGPKGTAARWIAVSAKQNLVTTSDAITISCALDDFGAVGRIGNNTQTSFVYEGQPPSAFDPLRFRDDIILCPQAQYAFAAEKRIIVCGRMRPHPAAIFIAPLDLSAAGGYSQNCADDASAISNRFLARVASGTLRLKYDDGAGSTTGTDFTLSSSVTLQDLCDQINATTTASNCKKWCAQLAPGVDGTITTDNLALTTSSDFGDDAKVSDATTGNMACYGPTWPGVLYFSQSYQSAITADDEGIWMTSSNPGAAQSAFRDFRISTRRKPSRSLGRCLGGAAVVGSNTGVIAVIYYERGRYALRNVRGGSSGVDDVYQLVEIGSARGCVSWSSIGSGNGWTHCMTEDGVECTDGNEALIISDDVWNREASGRQGKGLWAYEIQKSSAAAASGGTDTYCFISVFGSRLRVNYRASSSSSTIANRGVQYDFSSEGAARGLAELKRDDGTLFGWSCPITQSLGAMCMVVDSGGHKFYGAVESQDSAFSTGTGRIDQFDTGTDDNGTTIALAGYSRLDNCGSFGYKSTRYLDVVAHNPDNDMTFTMYRDTQRLVSSSFSIDGTSDEATRQRIWMPLDGSTDRYVWTELLWAANVLSTDLPKIYGVSNVHEQLQTLE